MALKTERTWWVVLRALINLQRKNIKNIFLFTFIYKCGSAASSISQVVYLEGKPWNHHGNYSSKLHLYQAYSRFVSVRITLPKNLVPKMGMFVSELFLLCTFWKRLKRIQGQEVAFRGIPWYADWSYFNWLCVQLISPLQNPNQIHLNEVEIQVVGMFILYKSCWKIFYLF